MSAPLIDIRGLVKRYGETTVLAGVDLAVQAGEVKVVMGPSGSGKSTLLRCLNRLVEPDAGQILMRGRNVLAADVDVRALRQAYPGVPIVTYINTYADVKAECDICCTSSNAVAVVESLKSDTVIFLPDEYLARNVAQIGRAHV